MISTHNILVLTKDLEQGFEHIMLGNVIPSTHPLSVSTQKATSSICTIIKES